MTVARPGHESYCARGWARVAGVPALSGGSMTRIHIVMQTAAAGLIAGTCLVLSAPVPAGSATVLVPHRAVYDLKLARSRGKRSIEMVRGRILYDFSRNACEGY